MSSPQVNGQHLSRFGLAGLAWRMSARAPFRLAALFLLLALVSFFLTGAELLQRGMGEAADRGAKRLGADMMVVPSGAEIQVDRGLFGGAPVRLALPRGVERAVAASRGVKAVAPQYFLFAANSPCCDTGELLLVGFDPARDFTVLPWLRSDKGSFDDDRSVVAGGVVRKAKGAELRIYNRHFTVAARLEKSGLGYFDNAVFIPVAGLAAMEQTSLQGGAIPFKLPWDRPSILLVLLSPGVDPEGTAAMLEQQVPGIRVLTMPQLFREKRDRVTKLAAWSTPLAVTSWLLAMLAGLAVWFPWWRERRPLLGLLQVCGIGRGAL
ncbi:MAG TPA: ABC transporter permease, partial [Geobacteraceae bacterium]|nr:ABC transporter permease [Geobacteraceae bacterium]